MAERRPEVSLWRQKFGPRVRVGQRQRGPSSTPSDEEGFTYGACTDAKGSGRPDLFSKNVSEQFHPVKRTQLANTCEHVLDFKRLCKKTIGAGGETGTTRFRRSVGAHYQNSRVLQMTLDVFKESQTTGGRIFFRRHLQVQYRNIRLVKSGPPNRGLQIVCRHYVILITQRPIKLLCDLGIVIDYQNPRLHRFPLGAKTVPLTRSIYEDRKQSGFGFCRELCMSTDVDTVLTVGHRSTRIRERILLGRLDRFRGWRWRFVVFFTDFIDDLQLSAKLLITTKLDVVPALKHKLRIYGRQ